MRVELHRTGGVANLKQQILLDEDHLFVIDRGNIKAERVLKPEECETTMELVQKIEQVKPNRFYGHNLVSDPIRTTLSIQRNSHTTEVEVLTDPADLPPPEVLALVRQLYQLAR